MDLFVPEHSTLRAYNVNYLVKIVKINNEYQLSYSAFSLNLSSFHIFFPVHLDFVWLRTLLKTRYEGMLVPSIPPRLLGNASLALCEPRKRLLTQFLTRLGFDDLLRRDPAVFAFISIADDAVIIRVRTSKLLGAVPWLFFPRDH